MVAEPIAVETLAVFNASARHLLAAVILKEDLYKYWRVSRYQLSVSKDFCFVAAL